MPDSLFPVRPEIAARAHVTAEGYKRMYAAAADPATFWAGE